MEKLKIERSMTRKQVYSVRRQARILASSVFGFDVKLYPHTRKNPSIMDDFSFSKDVVINAIDRDLFTENHYPTNVWDIADHFKRFGQINTAVKNNLLLPKEYQRL